MDRLNILHKFLLLTVTTLFVVNQTVLVRIQQDLHDAMPELRIKNEVVKQGTGHHAQVKVTLRDERTIDGYISRINEDRFTLVDPETGTGSELPFRIVKSVTESGSGHEGLVARGITRTAHAIESIVSVVE